MHAWRKIGLSWFIRFVTTLELNKSLVQVNCAPINELPSNISTMRKVDNSPIICFMVYTMVYSVYLYLIKRLSIVDGRVQRIFIFIKSTSWRGGGGLLPLPSLPFYRLYRAFFFFGPMYNTIRSQVICLLFSTWDFSYFDWKYFINL